MRCNEIPAHPLQDWLIHRLSVAEQVLRPHHEGSEILRACHQLVAPFSTKDNIRQEAR